MELLIKDFGVKEIRVCDDLFSTDEKRVIEVCNEITKRKLKLSWGCSARADLITKKMLLALKKAGCWEVIYGIESGSQEILNTIKKGLTLKTIKKAIKLTRESGLEARGFFMFGLPGDTEKTMQQTIDLAKNLKLDLANFYITIPFPGTELWQKGDKFGKINKKGLMHYTNQTTAPPFIPHGLTGEKIIKYHQKAHQEFFLRPSFFISRLLKIKTLAQLKAAPMALFSISRRFLK